MTGWIEQAVGFGVALTAVQAAQFQTFETLLLERNERMNLTALRTPELVRQRHFLDSLSCVIVTGDLNGRSLVDVGAGAGFPGVPLKLAFPAMRLTLVESVQKKARFLSELVEALGLQDVQVLSQRAETVGQDPAHRERYDWAVARAVAEMRVLAEYLLPLCRVGGAMLAQKGGEAAAETAVAANAIHLLGGDEPVVQPVSLPDQGEWHLVKVPKVAPTPVTYPRRPGVPAKRPL